MRHALTRAPTIAANPHRAGCNCTRVKYRNPLSRHCPGFNTLPLVRGTSTYQISLANSLSIYPSPTRQKDSNSEPTARISIHPPPTVNRAQSPRTAQYQAQKPSRSASPVGPASTPSGAPEEETLAREAPSRRKCCASKELLAACRGHAKLSRWRRASSCIKPPPTGHRHPV